ncbi:hypothetical protein GGR57DRAFT_340262 [Xylariaceae sp. FL1272]|nr:hypothetical protein GGR57DRAFT_340262 [Xylariaceae sp. FL1272]
MNLFWRSQSGTVIHVDEDFPSWSWAAGYGPLGDTLVMATTRHIDVRVWLKDNSDGNTRLLGDIDFGERQDVVLEDAYSSIIEIEGQTIDVTVVDWMPGNSGPGEEGNGLSVRVSLGSAGSLLARNESYDVSLSNCEAGRTFVASLLGDRPEPYYGEYGPGAIILEKTLLQTCWLSHSRPAVLVSEPQGSKTVALGWQCVTKRFWLA